MEQTGHGDRPTCGEGLAANAILPAKLAELMIAQAEVLKRHTSTRSDRRDCAKRTRRLHKVGARPPRRGRRTRRPCRRDGSGYRNLPMGRHDVRVMTDPKGQMEAFGRFVTVERDLLALLQSQLEADGELLR